MNKARVLIFKNNNKLITGTKIKNSKKYQTNKQKYKMNENIKEK